jgi:hypothetical protein
MKLTSIDRKSELKQTLTIQKDNISLAIRSINGNFPDYKQLFPKTFDTKIRVNKNELKNILNLSTVFVNNYSYIDIEVDVDKKIIRSKIATTKSDNSLVLIFINSYSFFYL